MSAISWKSPVSGSWTTAADWSSGAVPAVGDDVTIGIGGSYTVSIAASQVSIHSLTVSDPSAVLAIDSGGVGGSSVALTGALSNNGRFEIGNAGLTVATTVSVAGFSNSGEIDLTGGAAAQASLLVEPAAPATLTGKFILSGDALLGFETGAISAIGNGAELSLTGPKARVGVGSAPNSNSALGELTGNAGTLDLESGSIVTTAASIFANAGTLDIDTNSAAGGSRLTIAGLLTNNKIIAIGNGQLVAATIVTVGNLTNVGQITLTGSGSNEAALIVGNAAPQTLEGNYTLAGDALLEFASGGISEIFDGWTLFLDGAGARVALASAPDSNSALSTLANVNGTLRLDAGASITTAVDLTDSLTIEIDDIGGSGGSRLTIDGTLTNHGTLTIGNASLDARTIVSATDLVNTSNIDLTGANSVQATLYVKGAAPSIFTGDNKLTGDALLEYASGGINEIPIGEETVLDGPNARVALASAPNSNSALATLSTNDGTFVLENGVAVATRVGLVNNGNLQVDSASGTGGSRLTIGGTLTNFGAVTIGNGGLDALTIVVVSGLDDSAQIDLTGSTSVQATLRVLAPPSETVLGGTLIELVNDALLEYGPIVGISAGAELYIDGARARAALASATGGNSALKTFQDNAGTLRLDGGTVVGTSTAVTNSSTLEIDDSGGGSRLTVGGVLSNANGRLLIGNSGLNASTIVEAAGLSNTGTISLTGAVSVQATLETAGAAPGTLTGVNDLAGDALLEYRSGAIAAIGSGATLYLDGAASRVALASATGRNSALSRLATNAGTLRLDGGAIVATTTNFSNSGLVQVDDNSGGSRLTIGGTLTNNVSGSNGIAIGNRGLSAATLVKAAALVNTGEIAVTGSGTVQATLDITGAATGMLTGVVNLTGDALLEFGKGAITAIGSGATLYLNGADSRVALANATGRNSALAQLSTNAGTLRLDSGAAIATTTGLANSDLIEIDDVAGSGGSRLTIGGKLTNTAAAPNGVEIGNTALGSAVVVKAHGLVNSGAIDITGSALVEATLDITAAAPTSLGGAYKLTNDALLEFKSGAVRKIASGAVLDLTGRWARVALASATGSSSALKKLANNSGTLAIAGGAVLQISVTLSNTGTIDVDTAGAGGSSLTIGGELSNDGTFDIGNGSLTSAATVTVAGLENLSGGKIDIVGHAGPATLTLTRAAADAGTIEIDRGGVLVLDGRMSVASSGTVTLNGGEIEGGTLAGSGTIGSSQSSISTLDGVAIAAGAAFAAGAGSSLTMDHVTVDGRLTGGGTAGLVFGRAGTATMTNVSGFATIALANAGPNTLTLRAANFVGISGATITVYDGNAGNTVAASSLSSAASIIVHAGGGADTLTGGAGNDVFWAGGHTKMTGNAGTNEFAFDGPGAANVITDFAVSASNEIVFSNFGFLLGLSGAGATPRKLPSNLLVANATGKFTNATQRFAYDTTSHELFYSSAGNGSTPQLVATLDGHPGLSATQLFFVT